MPLSYLWQQMPALKQAGELNVAEKQPRQNSGRFRSAAATRSRSSVGRHEVEGEAAWGKPRGSRASPVLCCHRQEKGRSSRDVTSSASHVSLVPASPWSRGWSWCLSACAEILSTHTLHTYPVTPACSLHGSVCCPCHRHTHCDTACENTHTYTQ